MLKKTPNLEIDLYTATLTVSVDDALDGYTDTISADWYPHDDDRGAAILFLVPGVGVVVGNSYYMNDVPDGEFDVKCEIFVNGDLNVEWTSRSLFNARNAIVNTIRHNLPSFRAIAEGYSPNRTQTPVAD